MAGAAVTRAVGVVGVVGAGTMGAGIAQLAIEAGHEVRLHDVDSAAIERGRVADPDRVSSDGPAASISIPSRPRHGSTVASRG